METLATHQVDRGVAVMTSVLDDLGEVSLLGLDQQGVGPSLVALTRLEARVADLEMAQTRVAELEERMDFSERLLTQQSSESRVVKP